MSHFKGPDIKKAMPNFRPEVSILKIFADCLRKNGDMVAMIEGWSGNSVSHKELLQSSTAVAAGLRKQGVTAGDYVVICCEKSILAYSLLLGSMFTGATAVLYPIPHANEVHDLTMGQQIKAVFCDANLLDTIKSSLAHMSSSPKLVAVVDPADPVMQDLLSNEAPDDSVYDVKDPKKHTPLILYSSGTTGDPKGSFVTDVCLNCVGAGALKDLQGAVFLLASPLYWLSCIMMMSTSIQNNHTVLLSNCSDAQPNLQLISKYRADAWFTGTGSLVKYVNEPTLAQYDLSSIKVMGVGGETVVCSVYRDFAAKVLKGRVRVLIGYGSTETSVLARFLPDKPTDPIIPGQCGKPSAGVEIKIVDESDTVVPIGQLGELLAKSITMTTGYWGRPELNSQVFTEDSFFRTGDAGYFDNDGNVYVRGRCMDLINFRGTKVSPADCEDVLHSHPEVLDVAVVAVPHPEDVEHPRAFVVRVPGSSLTEEELTTFVNGKVDDNLQLRGGLRFLDLLPRTIIGKVRRKLLKEMN